MGQETGGRSAKLANLGKRKPSWQSRNQLVSGNGKLLSSYNTSIDLSNNRIKAIDFLVDNTGIGDEVIINLQNNPL
jgi:hypothetical protein